MMLDYSCVVLMRCQIVSADLIDLIVYYVCQLGLYYLVVAYVSLRSTAVVTNTVVDFVVSISTCDTYTHSGLFFTNSQTLHLTTRPNSTVASTAAVTAAVTMTSHPFNPINSLVHVCPRVTRNPQMTLQMYTLSCTNRWSYAWQRLEHHLQKY